MKADLYTKAVLTLIAVMLSVVAFNQFAKPVPALAASEQTQFALDTNGSFYLYTESADGNGEVKRYDFSGRLNTVWHLNDRPGSVTVYYGDGNYPKQKELSPLSPLP